MRNIQLFTSFILLALIFLTLFAGAAFAQREQIYTIQKGDTLWGLSQRFIADPYYWPNIWADNPDQITNPHLIFPGQKIRILDGRLEILPAYAEVPAGTTGTPITEDAANELTIRTTGRGDGFLLVDEQPLGRLVDSVDNRILLTETDMIFVSMNKGIQAAVGDTYGLFMRDQQVRHPQTDKAIGTMMLNLGYITVTEVRGSTVVARIDGAYREITRGAELFEYQPPVREIALQQGISDASGLIIASQEDKGTLSTGDLIFVDLGTRDQLATGNLLYITRKRQPTDEASHGAEHLDLPEMVLGAAIVTAQRDTSATALIIKSVDTAAIGDQIAVARD